MDISELKRMCQYLDERSVKCGRLAIAEVVGQRLVIPQAALRCSEHSTMIGPFEDGLFSYDTVLEGDYAPLGY